MGYVMKKKVKLIELSIGDSCYHMIQDSSYYMKVGTIERVSDEFVDIRYSPTIIRKYDRQLVRKIVKQ